MVRFLKALASVPAALACLCLAAEKAPLAGIKTPGVQIPFTKLKAEAEFDAAPAWLFVSGNDILLPAASGDTLAKIETKGNKMGEPLFGLSQPCSGAVNAFKSLWVPQCGSKSVARMESKKGEITKTLSIGASEIDGGIAATSDSVWVLTDKKATLSRIDPETNAVVGEVRLPTGCGQLMTAENSLWALCPNQDKLYRINPATNLIDQRIEVSANPTAVLSAEGSLWVLGAKEGKIDRIDPKTNKIVKTIELHAGGATGGLAFGEGNLWASVPGFPLMRIDVTAEKEKVVQQFWGEGGGWLEFGAGSLWIKTPNSKLMRIDPKRVVATLAE